MGKFIYLMDAYEDIGKDSKNNCYNVLNLMHKETEQDFETFSGLLLTSMMSECAKSFERLPICSTQRSAAISSIPVYGRNTNTCA